MLRASNPKQVDLISAVVLVAMLAAAYGIAFHKGITHYFYLKSQEKVNDLFAAILDFDRTNRESLLTPPIGLWQNVLSP